MSHDPDIKRFLKDPSLLIDLCREIIEQLDAGTREPDLGEKEAQLREISRTIDRLEKAGISIPPALRSEKTRLAAALGIKTEELQVLHHLADEFEDMLKDLNSRLGRGGVDAKPKRLRSKSSRAPKTDPKVLRGYIITALKKYGGRARVSDILDEMGRQLAGKLLPGDLELRQDGKTIAWQNNAQWERFKMTKDGALRSDSPNGYWELNEDRK
jgi:hypothetical protein